MFSQTLISNIEGDSADVALCISGAQKNFFGPNDQKCTSGSSMKMGDLTTENVDEFCRQPMTCTYKDGTSKTMTPEVCKKMYMDCLNKP